LILLVDVDCGSVLAAAVNRRLIRDEMSLLTLSSRGFTKRDLSICQYVEGPGSSALWGLDIATILAGRASLPRLAVAADIFIE
jgi:hypothetical protein